MQSLHISMEMTIMCNMCNLCIKGINAVETVFYFHAKVKLDGHYLCCLNEMTIL